MAPPKRKERGRPRKERIIGPRYTHRQRRERPAIPRRVQTNHPINVREMVYSLLNADKHNQEDEGRRFAKCGGFHGKRRKYQKVRKASYDSLLFRDSSGSIDDSEYTKSVATSADDLSRVMDSANSVAASSSENSSVSNISVEPIALTKSIDNTRALLKKKSLVQVINSYIRAGIEEGKREAKKYIRKALTFGVKSGYLIPTDPRGQVIRVSPTLIESRRSDAEARRRRRRARKGEDNPLICDKERRRPTPPWNATEDPYREVMPRPETPPKKRRKTSNSNDLSTRKTKKSKSPRKRAVRRARRGGSKKKTARRKKVTPYNSSDESEEDVEKPKKKQDLRNEVMEEAVVRKVRRARTPRARREGKENFRKNRPDANDEDEDNRKSSDNEENESTLVGRRKSTPSREDNSRESNLPPGHPAEEDEDKLESQNDENIENNNIETLN